MRSFSLSLLALLLLAVTSLHAQHCGLERPGIFVEVRDPNTGAVISGLVLTHVDSLGETMGYQYHNHDARFTDFTVPSRVETHSYLDRLWFARGTYLFLPVGDLPYSVRIEDTSGRGYPTTIITIDSSDPGYVPILCTESSDWSYSVDGKFAHRFRPTLVWLEPKRQPIDPERMKYLRNAPIR